MSANDTLSSDSTSSHRPSISSSLFPTIRLPPQNQTIVSHGELELHLSQQSELKAALIATYGAPGSKRNLVALTFLVNPKSLSEFFKTWVDNSSSMWAYLTKQVEPEALQDEIISLLNVEANLAGCVVLASLFKCFRENFIQSQRQPTTEKELISRFMDIIRALRPRRLQLRSWGEAFMTNTHPRDGVFKF